MALASIGRFFPATKQGENDLASRSADTEDEERVEVLAATAVAAVAVAATSGVLRSG